MFAAATTGAGEGDQDDYYRCDQGPDLRNEVEVADDHSEDDRERCADDHGGDADHRARDHRDRDVANQRVGDRLGDLVDDPIHAQRFGGREHGEAGRFRSGRPISTNRIRNTSVTTPSTEPTSAPVIPRSAEAARARAWASPIVRITSLATMTMYTARASNAAFSTVAPEITILTLDALPEASVA
jgi:hypothetical protein